MDSLFDRLAQKLSVEEMIELRGMLRQCSANAMQMEREACADLVEGAGKCQSVGRYQMWAKELGAAIRRRGQAEQ